MIGSKKNVKFGLRVARANKRRAATPAKTLPRKGDNAWARAMKGPWGDHVAQFCGGAADYGE